MKRRVISLMLVLAMIIGVIPVMANAEASTSSTSPQITGANLALSGILSINFKVDLAGQAADGYSLRVTIGNDTKTQNITQYSEQSGKYVYTAKISAHRLPENVKAELMQGETVVHTLNWTLAGYAAQLKAEYPNDSKLHELLDELVHYGNYAAYYAARRDTDPAAPAVEAVQASQLNSLKHTVKVKNSTLGATAYLRLNDACDLVFGFKKSEMEGLTLFVNGVPVRTTTVGEKETYTVSELLPQHWGTTYNVAVKDSLGTTVYEVDYGVMSYARIQLRRETESEQGLFGLLKSMYLYYAAALSYAGQQSNVVDSILLPDAWTVSGSTMESGSATLPANSSLKGEYFKSLWEKGYTHLVLNYKSETGAGQYEHSGTPSKYTHTLGTDTDIRIDLNEFHDGDTWYDLVFTGTDETFTVSNPRAYKSQETLSWTKSSTNMYFALEDGFYVLETRGSLMNVISPAEWYAHYDMSEALLWSVYAEYIYKGDNYRLPVWGYDGNRVDGITANSTTAGWYAVKASAGTSNFYLDMDCAGTVKIKIRDTVWSHEATTLTMVDEYNYTWSGSASNKVFLTSTQDLIRQGYTTLRVTLTGHSGNTTIWYGENDWVDGEVGVGPDKFVNGSYTFDVDLTTFKDTENFTMMSSGDAFTNIQVHIEPTGKVDTVVNHTVTKNNGEGYTINGADAVAHGSDYSFTVNTTVEYADLTVKVNGKTYTAVGGTYTVPGVQQDLRIDVELTPKAPTENEGTASKTPADIVLNTDNWNTIPQSAPEGAIGLSANSSLKASALKELWDLGYTHLVFTINAQNSVNFTHGGNWQRYYRDGLASTSGQDYDVRIDLNEFHDGDTWYQLNFTNGGMTVSNARAYKSQETLKWTKASGNENATASSNVYFAFEDGAYVLVSHGAANGVVSPTEWMKKYCHAVNSTALIYTEYITPGSNYRSVIGQTAHGDYGPILGDTTQSGWSKFAMTNSGYSEGDTLYLWMDSAATVRIKIADWVANRHRTDANQNLSYVDDNTILWTGDIEDKIHLASTHDLIAQGYTKLRVTLTGDLGEATVWYNGDVGAQVGIGAGNFTNGSYTFEEDLTDYSDNEIFTLMYAGSGVSTLQVKVEPIKPVESYTVTKSNGTNYTINGADTAVKGENYTFTVNPSVSYSKLTVLINGKPARGVNNTYTVTNVQENLSIEVVLTPGPHVEAEAIVLNPTSWSNVNSSASGSITLNGGAALTATAIQELWEKGYTHLVFTVNATSGGDFIHSGTDWRTQWINFAANTPKDIRLDLSEFLEGGEWKQENIINMAEGSTATISNVRAYKSPETLEWEKISTNEQVNGQNMYLANEDGYYVLEIRSGAVYIQSPEDWYANRKVGKFWFVYSEYLANSGNNRMPIWGVDGEVKNGISELGILEPNWYVFDGGIGNSTFRLSMDGTGTVKLKFADFVSNYNTANVKIDDDYSFRLTTTQNNNYKLYWTNTTSLKQDYTHLEVVVGELGNTGIWYGDDWSSYSVTHKTSNSSFTVDLSKIKAGKPFTLQFNNKDCVDNSAPDAQNLLIQIKPINANAEAPTPETYYVYAPEGEGFTFTGDTTVQQGSSYTFTVAPESAGKAAVVTVNGNVITGEGNTYTVTNVQSDLDIAVTLVVPSYNVTAPTGEGFTFWGDSTVAAGKNYTFTVTPHNADATVTVRVNGEKYIGDNGYYVVPNVLGDLTVTVEIREPADVTKGATLSSNWELPVGANTLITVPANAHLTAAYLKKLWEAGYTHLVFKYESDTTVTNETAFVHGNTWNRYWRGLGGLSGKDIRIDLNEFHDGDTWYDLVFQGMSESMTISNPRAYKSPETLEWTKASTNESATPSSNVYFAFEDGAYVLESFGAANSAISPTEWLEKYCGNLSNPIWNIYTDYIYANDNTVSVQFGWGGDAVNNLDVAAGGWKTHALKNTAYQDGEVLSWHLAAQGTARIKMSDIYSNNINGYTYASDTTFTWTAAGNGHKMYLASTQELIAEGYNKLRVTLQGDLGSAQVWYGEDDWDDGEIGVGADKFTNGIYTFEVDLSEFKDNERFTMMANAAFTDLAVEIKPIKSDAIELPYYDVAKPTGNGFTFTGNDKAVEGKPYSFKVEKGSDPAVTDLTVRVNGEVLTKVNDVYTVQNVTGALDIDVAVTLENAIVKHEGVLDTAVTLLDTEFDAVTQNFKYTFDATDTLVEGYAGCIVLGSNFNNPQFRSENQGEAYAVKNDGSNVYIDGNGQRGVLYGAYDYLRALGYEFYAVDITTRPNTLSDITNVDIEDEADFAVRAYLAGETSYDLSADEQKYTASAKFNNANHMSNMDSYGNGVQHGFYGSPVHNFYVVDERGSVGWFADNEEGKYGKTVATGVAGIGNSWAPCLTSGITHDTEDGDNTLTYAVARAKQLLQNDESLYWLNFTQNDGTTWYCDCEHCEASNEVNGCSGTLVNFCNAMIEMLHEELPGREFNVITYAYHFTAAVPTNEDIRPHKDLTVWYAKGHDLRYSLTDDKQIAAFKDNLQKWLNLTNGKDAAGNDTDGAVALWLYDCSFNNYLAYLPSTTINGALVETISIAKEAGIQDILINGSYNADNLWHSEMKAYIWSKLLWDSELTDENVKTLQNNFISAYFGPAAEQATEFISLYDTVCMNNTSNAEADDTIVQGGTAFYSRNRISMKVHGKAIEAAMAGIAEINDATDITDKQKEPYLQHINSMLATAYGMVIYDFDWSGSYDNQKNGHYDDCTATLDWYGCNDYLDCLGGATTQAEFFEILKATCVAAGITKTCEPTADGGNNIQWWFDNYVSGSTKWW